MQRSASDSGASNVSKPRIGRLGRILGLLLLLVLAVAAIWWIDRQAMKSNGPTAATQGPP